MEIIERYLKLPPFFRSKEEKPASRFGINESMVPTFSKGAKGVSITANKAMRFRYLNVKDNIAPVYPEKLKTIREKIEDAPLRGEFNLREEIKKVRFKDVQEEIEPVEYEIVKEEAEQTEQPYNRGEYLSRVLQRGGGPKSQLGGEELRGFRIQGTVSADSKVRVLDVDDNKSYNPIKYARWYKSTHTFLDGDELIYEPSPVYEGLEWKITRDCIGLYLNVVTFRGNYIYNKCRENILQAKDLHFNDHVRRKLDSIIKKEDNGQIHSEYAESRGDSADSIAEQSVGEMRNYCVEEITIGPVLVPDYIAYHALNLICEEGLSCNVILLDRPRDAFSNERVCGKVGAKETQESGNKQISENEYKAKKESNGDNTLNNVGNKADLSSETEKRNETVLEKGPIREDNKGKDSEQNPQDRDDDYEEEDDYLAYRRKEYEGVVECQLMDGNLKISYNTEKDREKERARIENAKNDQDRKLRYRKGVQLDFDQFYLTIDRSATNTSTVKMIVFESENNTYDIRLRIDPKFGRDLFYYSVIAFQRCYQEQKYDWDDNLKRGNIIPMKEFIQDQLELLSLKGFF